MSKPPIIIQRSETSVNMVITLFAIIQNTGNAKEMTVEGNNIYIRKKLPEEIQRLNQDTTALQGKLLDMFHNPAPVVYLTSEESDLFRQCVHAAYYWMTERDGD